MNSAPKYAKQLNNERGMESFIPFSSHISPNTIITKGGDFLRTWRVGGISFETSDLEEVVIRKDQLNAMIRSLGTDQIAFWTHNIRRKTTGYMDAKFDNDFCERLNDKYYNSFNGYRMMVNELYLTAVYRPYPTRMAKALVKSSRSLEEIKDEQLAAIKQLDEIAFQIEASMKRYDLEALTTYEENGVLYSNLLSFLNYLLTANWQKMRVPSGPLYEAMGDSWLFFGIETAELRGPVRTQFIQGIDLKNYPKTTEGGLINNLMYEDYEYIITQSFSVLSLPQGKRFLEERRRQLLNTDDGSVSQIGEIDMAIDQLIAGEFCMGEYHYSMLIYGDTDVEVVKNKSSAIAILQALGFTPYVISTATDSAFYAQLPGNWKYRPREATLTSLNFVGLSSFHNFHTGKAENNPWGPAVTMFKTPSGQPLYFNFHYSRDDENAFDRKVLGNTRIIGQSGAGKTVLMNFLMCQSQKFRTDQARFTNIYFDKDRGSELAIRRIGGKYFRFMNGQPTGLNPMQMDPTEENIQFLEKLVSMLIMSDGQGMSAHHKDRLSHAIRTVMDMPKERRGLSRLLQNLPEGIEKAEIENSISKRLSNWCFQNNTGRPGSLWWVLDCKEDLIDFTTHNIYGFDGTDFLDNEITRSPMSLYLLHRMQTVIDGRRFKYDMDEAWKWVDDEVFGEFAGNSQLTIRKLNGLGVFSTQMPSSLLQSKIASQLVQQCATEIYLPNPRADYHEYVNGFKVSESEFGLIKNMDEESRRFIIKQGHQSAIAELDLSGNFDDELAILSGSADNLELFDEIIEEFGEDPKVWEPIFHQRRKERKTKNAQKRTAHEQELAL